MPAANTERIPAITVQDADQLIRTQTKESVPEERPLREAAGYVLREPISADRDFPPFERVTKDGIAFSFASYSRGRREFRVQGTQAAGMPRLDLPDPDACIEVMTGAVLPGGCDCVVPVEEIRRSDTGFVLESTAVVEQYANVHRQGSDHNAGELLVRPGTLLRSPELAVCATVGKASLLVSRRPAAAVLSTGDELVEVDHEPLPYQIRMSNNYAVGAAIERSGCASVELFHVKDDRQAIEEMLSRLLERYDLLVLSGGVSAGKFDMVPDVLESLGVRTIFHRVKQRPGFPLLFAVSPDGRGIFALPGNPVSSLVSTHRYVIPYLNRTLGIEPKSLPQAVLAGDYRFGEHLTLFLTVRAEARSDGTTAAFPLSVNGSGDLVGITEGDGFIELPADRDLFEAGTIWPLYRWI